MNITPDEFNSLQQENINVFDLRSADEYAHGCLPGAVNIAAAELLASPPDEKDKRVIVYLSLIHI